MNEFSALSNETAPIPSPNDIRVLTCETAPSPFAAAFGHFLLFGFFGQIAYTVIELGITANTHGQAEAHDSVNKQLLLLMLPALCAIGGALFGLKNPVGGVRNPIGIVSLVLAIGVVGVFDLLVLVATGMAGYC